MINFAVLLASVVLVSTQTIGPGVPDPRCPPGTPNPPLHFGDPNDVKYKFVRNKAILIIFSESVHNISHMRKWTVNPTGLSSR